MIALVLEACFAAERMELQGGGLIPAVLPAVVQAVGAGMDVVDARRGPSVRVPAPPAPRPLAFTRTGRVRMTPEEQLHQLRQVNFGRSWMGARPQHSRHAFLPSAEASLCPAITSLDGHAEVPLSVLTRGGQVHNFVSAKHGLEFA